MVKTFMAFALALCLALGWMHPAAAQAPRHDAWTALLRKNVSATGVVNYKGFIRDKAALQAYLDLLSRQTPDRSRWTKSEQLAFWINAYNAFTVKLIVDHYPLKSIKDLNPALSLPTVNTVWQKKFFAIGGQPMSLDHIEHEILRKEFQEPRIHFAINCASVSCPALLNEAYTAEGLEAQLQKQTSAFINDPSRNKLAKNDAKLSQVFNWFAADFTRTGTLIWFINRYAKNPVDKRATISFLEYDWRLNE